MCRTQPVAAAERMMQPMPCPPSFVSVAGMHAYLPGVASERSRSTMDEAILIRKHLKTLHISRGIWCGRLKSTSEPADKSGWSSEVVSLLEEKVSVEVF